MDEQTGLIDSLRRRMGLPLEEIASGVHQDLREFLGENQPNDDITLMLLRRSP